MDPNMFLESYIDAQDGYVQNMCMDMLREVSWPCQFLSPTLVSAEYMDMPSYPVSPMSPGSMPVSSHAQGATIQRQRQSLPPLSARTSITSTQSSGSPREGFVNMVQPPRQDRERRKAQNRASQRAYRERKEVQLRDLAASLKEMETVMAEAKRENEQLDARLQKMRNEMEGLRRENEALRRMNGAQGGSWVHEEITGTRYKGMNVTPESRQGGSTPPHSDEGYGGDSRSNTASVIGTPEDMEIGGLDWDCELLESKRMPATMADEDDQVLW